jgi:hypothetical protein
MVACKTSPYYGSVWPKIWITKLLLVEVFHDMEDELYCVQAVGLLRPLLVGSG